MNKYTNITKYYDLLMESGYYSYDNVAKALVDDIGESKKILELGIGTGLVSEKLLSLHPYYQIVGIDNTKSMLDLAAKRLKNRAELIYGDIRDVRFLCQFDAIFSQGGVFYFIDKGNGKDFMFCSHIPDIDGNQIALNNISKHLDINGIFLLSIQGVHKDFVKPLAGSVIYSQYIQELGGGCFDKKYVFKNGKEELNQKCRYKLLDSTETEELMTKAGLEFQKIDTHGKFHIYRKSKK